MFRSFVAEMGVSQIAYLVLLLVVGCGRLVELSISVRHQRLLSARGIAKVPERYFRLMVPLHVGVLLSAGLEVLLLHRPLIPFLSAIAGLLFIFANVLRWWVIVMLSDHWNVQIMASTKLGVVTSGPYRRIRHPNYVAVFVELFALPLIHTAWLTALWASAAHLWVLRQRIAAEDKVLLADEAYRSEMGNKPRFMPRVFSLKQKSFQAQRRPSE